jgi:hypothetical protein
MGHLNAETSEPGTLNFEPRTEEQHPTPKLNNPKNPSTTSTRETKFPIDTLEIKREIKKNDYRNHMDSGIFDEPECMGKRRGRL